MFSFDRIRLFAGNTQGDNPFADWLVDEFRVGTTYASVTPIEAPPVAGTNVPEPRSLALAIAIGWLAWCGRADRVFKS